MVIRPLRTGVKSEDERKTLSNEREEILRPNEDPTPTPQRKPRRESRAVKLSPKFVRFPIKNSGIGNHPNTRPLVYPLSCENSRNLTHERENP
jgi:hypothetical protein